MNNTEEEMSVSDSMLLRRTSLDVILRENRRKLGMPETIPIRPFMLPNRIRGELSNRVTQFVLSQVVQNCFKFFIIKFKK